MSAGRHSEGGKERARRLSASRRQEIAQAGAETRWGRGLPIATHDGEIVIGNTSIACAVLETTKRVLTQETFLEAIGRAKKAKAGTGSARFDVVDTLPPFLAADNLKPFISDALRESTTPVVYRTTRGQRAFGFDAALLPQVCEVYLKARDAGELLPSQKHIVKACDILMRGLARVGIIALVDEATGYQADRDRDALVKILEAFVAKELRAWVRTFPPDFYKELFRLRGLQYPAARNPPQYIGKLTNNIVYERLAPGVLVELRSKNPADDRGARRARHHQWLTGAIGHPKLLQHLSAVIALMKASSNYDEFIKMLDKALPRYEDMPLLTQKNE